MIQPIAKKNNQGPLSKKVIACLKKEKTQKVVDFTQITKSYFSCWGFFDLCVGLQKETFGTIAIDIQGLRGE